VPRGGEFRLTLSDGTEVTLNAATTLRFPARFTGDRREVWLAGEAYFRVTADASRPFTVRANGTVTTALGTEFNVMAYPDDRSTGITLVSGAVEVVAGGKPERLSPGYQLDVDNATGETRRERVDAATMTAWHTGIFRFDNIPLVELMHRVERWCDVPFRFRGEGLEGKVFTGGFRRYEPLERILRMIGEVNDVTFRLENDTILIDNK
jgi:ferric-dicitrate binding protein FerR (iron transport regulator)